MAETSAGSQTASDMLDITIKTLQRGAFSVRVPRYTTVSQMKERLQPVSQIPASRQRLIFKGRVLRDEQTMQEAGIENGNAVHLVERPADAPPATGTGQPDATSNRPGMQSVPGLGPTGNMQDFGRFLSGVLGSLTGGVPTVPGGPPNARGPFGVPGTGGAQQPQQRESLHLLLAINTFLNTLNSAAQPPPPIPITSLHPRFQEGSTQPYRWLTSALHTLLENSNLHPDLQATLQQATRELEASPPVQQSTSSNAPTATAAPASTPLAASAPPSDSATAAFGPTETPSTHGFGQPGPTTGGEPAQPGRQGLRRPPAPLYPYAQLIVPAIASLVQRAIDYSTGPLSRNVQADIDYLQGVHSLEGNRQEVVTRMRELTGRLHAAAALLTELARASAAATLALDGNAAALAFNSSAVLSSDGTHPSFPRLLPRADTPHIADAFIVRGDIDPSQLPPGMPPFPPSLFPMPNMGSPMPGVSPGGTPGPTPTPADGSGAQTPAGTGASTPMPDMGQGGAATARFGPFMTPTGAAFGGISIQGDGPLDLGQQIMNMFGNMPGAQMMAGPTTTTIAVTSAQFGEPVDVMGGASAPAQGAAAGPTADAGGMPTPGMPDLSNLNLPDLQFPDMGAIRIDMADVSLPQLLQQFQGMMGANFMNPPPEPPSQQQGAAGSRSTGAVPDLRADMATVLQALSPVIQSIVQNVVSSITNHAATPGGTSASSPGTAAASAAAPTTNGVPSQSSPELTSAITDAVSTSLEAVLATISRNLDGIERGLQQVEQRTGQDPEFMDVMRQISSVLASSFSSRGTSGTTPAATTGTAPAPPAPPQQPSTAHASTTGTSTAQEQREETAGPSSSVTGVGAAPSMPPRGLGGALRPTSAKRKAVSAAAKSAAAASSAAAATPSAEETPAAAPQPHSNTENSEDAGGDDWHQLLEAANVMRSATGASSHSGSAASAQAPPDGMASLLNSFGGLASQLSSQQGGSGAMGGGGGGGLGNLFQMAGRIASDPAMRPMIEQAASDLFGGGQSGGGLGNLLGSLLGGGAATTSLATSQPRTRGGVPADLTSLANLDIRDAEQWRDMMDADEVVQASMPSQPPFSDAYLAGAPPKSKSLFKRNEGPSQE